MRHSYGRLAAIILCLVVVISSNAFASSSQALSGVTLASDFTPNPFYSLYTHGVSTASLWTGWESARSFPTAPSSSSLPF